MQLFFFLFYFFSKIYLKWSKFSKFIEKVLNLSSFTLVYFELFFWIKQAEESKKKKKYKMIISALWSCLFGGVFNLKIAINYI